MATVVKKIKLQIPGGAATPAHPVGTALGPAGVNIGQFVTQFNAATQDKKGTIIPIELSVYDDRSFTFIMKNPPPPPPRFSLPPPPRAGGARGGGGGGGGKQKTKQQHT